MSKSQVPPPRQNASNLSGSDVVKKPVPPPPPERPGYYEPYKAYYSATGEQYPDGYVMHIALNYPPQVSKANARFFARSAFWVILSGFILLLVIGQGLAGVTLVVGWLIGWYTSLMHMFSRRVSE